MLKGLKEAQRQQGRPPPRGVEEGQKGVLDGIRRKKQTLVRQQRKGGA